MPNHYRLLAETTEANLSQAMQWLNVSYTIWFNRRHQRVGHLFQGRFKSVLVEPQTWALGLSRYIHLNPVRVRQLALGHDCASGPVSNLDAEFVHTSAASDLAVDGREQEPVIASIVYCSRRRLYFRRRKNL